MYNFYLRFALCPQFSCASPSHSCPDSGCEVWVCNSDGYVGQVSKHYKHPALLLTSQIKDVFGCIGCAFQ